MGRHRKSKLPQLKIKQETIFSVLAVLLITLGLLVVVSFTGQGVILQMVNEFLRQTLGLSMLLLPFVFVSAGLVLLQTK